MNQYREDEIRALDPFNPHFAPDTPVSVAPTGRFPPQIAILHA
jgi:hypothetical protein